MTTTKVNEKKRPVAREMEKLKEISERDDLQPKHKIATTVALTAIQWMIHYGTENAIDAPSVKILASIEKTD